MNKEEYGCYLKSDHWQAFRLTALERAGNKCALCGDPERVATLNVHHNSYNNLGKEEPTDVVVLCEICHNNYHSKCLCLHKQWELRQYYRIVITMHNKAHSIFDSIALDMPGKYISNMLDDINHTTVHRLMDHNQEIAELRERGEGEDEKDES